MKILVIGGGVAGSVVSYLLGKNFDVTLIQNKKWDKPCGGGVKSKIFDEFNFDKSLIKHNLNKVAVKYKNKTIFIDLKGDNLSIVRRDEFDEYLRNLATKYAKLYFGRFITIKDKKAIIKIDNKKEIFEFDILIGADGVNSSVRKAINLEPIPKILTYFAKIDKKTLYPEFYFDKKFGGDYYAWIFPHENLTHIGSVDAKCFKYFCNYLNVDVKPKGYFIPSWQENITIQKENIYFVGDAAAQVMPLTFEGIYYAIKSAQILANSIINNLDYKTEWDKIYLKKFKFMKIMENINKTFLKTVLINSLQINKFQNFAINLWLGGKR